jgi:CRISPR/Cas system-associated protein endoribonuclease Cas2
MTDNVFVVNFDLDLDCFTEEEKRKNTLNWNQWKTNQTKILLSNKRSMKEVCIFCRIVCTHDSMRVHVKTKTHLQNEQNFKKLYMH